MSKWRREQDFKPLYTGMAAEDAGAVVEKLKESGVEYRVTDNGTSVLVSQAKVAEVRLAMAAAGLPKTGRMGFELFDKTNLGATDFAEQVNYRRALEGELERTIKSIAEVEHARVHLSFPKDSVFLENRLPAKASVLLKLRPAARMTPSNVLAIEHMVASAVEGLAPEAVSILDVHGNLLSRPSRPGQGDENSEAAIEYRQKLERDLLAKVNSTLEPLLGADKYRAGISVECDFTSGEQSEETYDPERSVMITSQKSEETSTTANSGGLPGTASNLPRPPARTGSGNGLSRRTENIAYQSSKTVRRLRLPQGSIKRISASVLLDQAVRWEGKPGKMQRVLVPPSPESIRAIREVVAGIIGFVPNRGDQLVIETLPFESTLQTAAPAAPEAPGKPGTPGNMLFSWPPNPFVLGVVAGVLVLLGLAAFLLWRVLRRRRKAKVVVTPAVEGPKVSPEKALEPATASSEALLEQAQQVAELEEDLRIPIATRVQKLIEGIQVSIDTDPALAAKVLRSWLEETKK